MHRRMDEIVDRVSKFELTKAAVQGDVTEMMPVTEDVKRWKPMGLGALGVIGIGGMVLGVAFADVIRRVAMAVLGR